VDSNNILDEIDARSLTVMGLINGASEQSGYWEVFILLFSFVVSLLHFDFLSSISHIDSIDSANGFVGEIDDEMDEILDLLSDLSYNVQSLNKDKELAQGIGVCDGVFDSMRRYVCHLILICRHFWWSDRF
jgi:hypothetical protein